MNKLRLFFLAVVFCGFVAPFFADDSHICIHIWAELDPEPGIQQDFTQEQMQNEDDFTKVYGHSVKRAAETAPYLLAGMLNGYYFEYTPYDKKRQVQEYWEFELLGEFNPKLNPITYRHPLVIEGGLNVWANCERQDFQLREYKRWDTLDHARIMGKGAASVELGFEGIKQAVSDCAKNAVREYYRGQTKNKPKSIEGRLLLVGDPLIGVKNGEYVVDLDFFVETDRIINYTYY